MSCAQYTESQYGRVRVYTSSTRPTSATDRYVGVIIYESDTNRYASWNGSAWRYIDAPPLCEYRAAISVAGSDATISDATLKTLVLGTEAADTDGFATAASSTAVTIPTGKGGWYNILIQVEQTASGTGTGGYIQVITAGSLARTFTQVANSAQGTYFWAGALRLAAGDTITFKVFQNSGGAKTISGNSYVAVRLVAD